MKRKEIEQTIIAYILTNGENAMIDIAEKLDHTHFKNVSYSNIYKVVFALFSESVNIDILNVKKRLKRLKMSFEVSDLVMSSYVNKAEIETYILSLLEFSMRQDLQKKLAILSQDLANEKDVFEVLDKFQEFASNSGVQIENNLLDLSNLANNTILELQEKRKNKTSGLSFGFQKLDYLTGGANPTDLICIAGRPAMGKTSFAIQLAMNFSNCLVFSLEMSKTQLMNRILSMYSGVNSSFFRTPALLEEAEMQAIQDASLELRNKSIFIEDSSNMTTAKMRTIAKKHKRKYGLDVIVIDYLQLISVSDRYRGNKNNEMEEVSKDLKMLAKDLNIPIIFLSQLSRGVEQRQNKRPMLSDLRDSGGIEQNIDICLSLYRPEYYGITEDEMGDSTQGLTEVNILKNRHGGLDNIKLEFIHELTKFQEYDRPEF